MLHYTHEILIWQAYLLRILSKPYILPGFASGISINLQQLLSRTLFCIWRVLIKLLKRTFLKLANKLFTTKYNKTRSFILYMACFLMCLFVCLLEHIFPYYWYYVWFFYSCYAYIILVKFYKTFKTIHVCLFLLVVFIWLLLNRRWISKTWCITQWIYSIQMDCW